MLDVVYRKRVTGARHVVVHEGLRQSLASREAFHLLFPTTTLLDACSHCLSVNAQSKVGHLRCDSTGVLMLP